MTPSELLRDEFSRLRETVRPLADLARLNPGMIEDVIELATIVTGKLIS